MLKLITTLISLGTVLLASQPVSSVPTHLTLLASKPSLLQAQELYPHVHLVLKSKIVW